MLPPAIKESSNMLLSTQSEIGWTENGLVLTDKSNPNYVTLINSSGIGVSKDGGQTFEEAIRRGAINANLITAGAMNANYIRAGKLNADLVEVVGAKSSVRLNSSGLHIKRGQIDIQRPDGATWVQNGIPKFSLAVQRNQFMSPDVGFSGQSYSIPSAFFLTYENFYVFHDARYLVVSFACGVVDAVSAWQSIPIECRVLEFGKSSGNAQARTTITAYQNSSSSFGSVTLDLGVPTYEPRQFYLQARVASQEAVKHNTGYVRTNRVHMKG